MYDLFKRLLGTGPVYAALGNLDSYNQLRSSLLLPICSTDHQRLGLRTRLILLAVLSQSSSAGMHGKR